MKIALDTSAIRAPLTGIGRYAYELAMGLPGHADIEDVRYLRHTTWAERRVLESQLNAVPGSGPAKTGQWNYKRALREQIRKVGRVKPVAAAYQELRQCIATRLVNKSGADLLHGPNYFIPRLDIPSVVTVHDLSTFVDKSWHPPDRVVMANRMIPKSIRNARLVLTDAESTRIETIGHFGLRPEDVVAVPLGVDEKFTPMTAAETEAVLTPYGLTHGQYSLFVSTIEPRKNILGILQAYRMLPAPLRTRYPLVMAGGHGWNSQEIHDRMQKAAAEGWLHYLGFVPEAHMPVLYAGARLFVYPSFYEGFGLPIAEAMASGVPVVTANTSSMPEVAGGAAWLVAPQDTDALKDGFGNGLENDAWREQAIEKGLARASELTWKRCVDLTVAAYRTALSR